MRTVATRTILVVGVAIQMAGPSLAGSDLAGDRSDVIAEGDRAGHHWQQGQWFDYPLAYRTPRPAAVDVPLVTDRHAMALALAAASERTGYARDGACDPASLEEVEATMAFAFRLTDRMPADHDLHFDPEFMSDGGVVGAEIV